MTNREIQPLNVSGVQPSREAQSLQGDLKSCLCPQAHHMSDAHQLAPPGAFFHLTRDQARRHLPLASTPSFATSLEPVSKMGRERIKVHVQAVTGKEWEAQRQPGSVGASG